MRVFATVVVIAILGACAGSAENGSLVETKSPSSDGGSSPPSKPPSPPVPGTGSPGTRSDAGSGFDAGSSSGCGAQTTEEACSDCCASQHTKGAATAAAAGDAMQTCLCAAGACGTACAQSACAATPSEPASGDPCDKCIEADTQCSDAAEKACNADPDCAALNECIESSGCDSKG
jgi:hypothetical protein